MWRPGAPGVIAVGLVLVAFTLVLTSAHTLGARKNDVPNVFPLPEQSGLTLSISGTHRAKSLIDAQPFEVRSAALWDVERQAWWTYVVGAPGNVNRDFSHGLRGDSFVWMRRADSAALSAPAELLPTRASFSDAPTSPSILPTPPQNGLTVGLAGTRSPQALADAQGFTVQSISVFEVAVQEWKTFLPGEPGSSTLTSLLEDDIVWVVRGCTGLDPDFDPSGWPVTAVSESSVDCSSNHAPVAQPDGYSLRSGGTSAPGKALGVLANDHDADGDVLAASLLTDVSRGVLTLARDGSFEYTPDAGYLGSDSFTYRVSDGMGGTDTETVSLEVAEANRLPVAVDDFAGTSPGTVLTVDVLANDFDPDGDALSVLAVTQGGHGSVEHDGGVVTYTPDAGFSGSDSFVYSASDGNGGSDSATVTITVEATSSNGAPTAVGDSTSTQEATPVTIPVLGNDFDPDGDFLTVTIASAPFNGSAQVNSNGTITYTPSAGFSGSDAFVYEIDDGNGGTDTATVSVTVTAASTLPPASGSAFIETWDGDPSAPQPLGGAFAPKNWDIQIDDTDDDFWAVIETTAVNAHHQATCGNPFQDGTGTHEWTGAYEDAVYRCKNHLMTFLGQGGYAVTYLTPNQLLDLRGGQGVVRFDVSTLAPQNRDWLDIWISPWEDALVMPLESGANAYQGPPRNAVHIKGDVHESGQWAGFRVAQTTNWVSADLLKAKHRWTSFLPVCSGPNDPSTTCAPSAKNRQTVEIILTRTHIKVWAPQYGVVWVDADLPQPIDWDLAVVTFGHHRYNAFDHKGCGSPVAGESCSNTWHWDNHTIDPAVPFTMIKGDVRRVAEGTSSDTASKRVTFDSPAPTDAYLRFSAVGTVEVSYDGGPYQPAQRRLGAHEAGVGKYGHRPTTLSSYWTPIPAGTQTVDFRLSADGSWSRLQAKDFGIWSLSGSSSSSGRTTNRAPVALDDAASTAAGTAVTIDVIANDSDADGDSLSVTGAGPAANGAVANVGGGRVRYTPVSGFSGSDSFAYTVTDGRGGTDTATVTVAVGSGGSSGGGPSPATGTRLSWLGQDWFAAGANLPWIDWAGDFGTANGVASSAKQANLHTRFSGLETAGVHAVRWWMFEGGAARIQRDGSGRPTAVDPAVYADIDAALALAETYDLYYTFVLFAGPDDIPKSWMTDASHRAALADALAPLFARYSGNPRLMTWEVFNEPEWAMWNGRVPNDAVIETVREVASAVHANSTANVTVGSAHIGGLGFWVGVGLDYYDAHWYDGMTSSGSCAMCTDYASLQAKYGLDAPLVIGEFFGGSTADGGALARWEAWYAKGYAGAWGWSLRPAADGMTIDMGALGTFTSGKSDIGPSSP